VPKKPAAASLPVGDRLTCPSSPHGVVPAIGPLTSQPVIARIGLSATSVVGDKVRGMRRERGTKALFTSQKILQIFHILHHIESLDVCMKY